MGVDWIRMRVRPGIDPFGIRDLIEKQSQGFRAFSGWYGKGTFEGNILREKAPFDVDAYAAAENKLRDCLEIVGWDAERECPTDGSPLQRSMRVYSIAQNPILPPLWRTRAYRTFLVDELKVHLDKWQFWVREVAEGKHEAYVAELMLYEACVTARGHWSELRRLALESTKEGAKWAHQQELTQVRERIIWLPEIELPVKKVDPSAPLMDAGERERLWQSLGDRIKEMIQLTREWDRHVRGNRKLKYYDDCYELTLEEFRKNATAPWLGEFFRWANGCVQEGFGLYLDS
jgi:hypothetical protein